MSKIEESATRWDFCIKCGIFPRLFPPDGWTAQKQCWIMHGKMGRLTLEMGRGDTPEDAVDAAIASLAPKKD